MRAGRIQGMLGRMDAALPKPGQFPFTSGIHPEMYRTNGGRLWTMRMFSGMGDARQTNQRWKMLIAGGQTGLSTAYDDPTLAGIDPTHPQALGTVGKSGVHVSRLPDYEALYDGIDIGAISSSQTINGPAALHYAAMVALADLRGVPRAALRGTTQTDILKEYIAQNEFRSPPGPSIRLIMDMMFFAAEHTPQWYPISISGYHIGEKGATQAEEVGLTLANGLTYVEEGIKYGRRLGLEIDHFAPRLSFFFSAKPNFYEVIACFRAARRIWAGEMQALGAQNPKSLTLKFHTQTSGRSLTTNFPLNNITRTALQALAAVFGGTQSLHTNSADEELGLPSELAVMAALHTQQIIAFETGIPEVADPFRGSVYLERLTDRCEEKMRWILAEVRKRGGMMTEEARLWALEVIGRSSLEAEHAREMGQRKVVGVNLLPAGITDFSPFNPFPETPIPRSIETGVTREFKAWLRSRDKTAVRQALDSVRKTATGSDNIIPVIVSAEKAGASFGEIMDALTEVWGEYHQPIHVLTGTQAGLFNFSANTLSRRDALISRLGRAPKIYLSKIGIDFHDAGISRIAKMLRELGFTVILGNSYRATAQEVATATIQEDVDVIGLSNLSSSYLEPTRKLLGILSAQGREDIPVVLGGIVRFDTMEALEKMGVAGVARPGTTDDQIADLLLTLLERKDGA